VRRAEANWLSRFSTTFGAIIGYAFVSGNGLNGRVLGILWCLMENDFKWQFDIFFAVKPVRYVPCNKLIASITSDKHLFCLVDGILEAEL
jgi:hypothetical protein